MKAYMKSVTLPYSVLLLVRDYFEANISCSFLKFVFIPFYINGVVAAVQPAQVVIKSCPTVRDN